MAQTTDSSVFSIITAFTSGLDVFRKLRERRRVKKKRKASKGSGEKESGEHLRLSKSLRRGPVDIEREYEKQRAKHGRRYEIGDGGSIVPPVQPRQRRQKNNTLTCFLLAIANTSLTKTLVKLNTGLVNIITSFLCCKGGDTQLDYKSLTSLSDISRLEAVEALGQLSKRLSQSSPTPLLPSGSCSRCGCGRHRGACKKTGKPALTKANSVEALGGRDNKHNEKEKQKSTKSRSRQPPAAHTVDSDCKVRMVHLSSASEPQLAIVRSRPRNRRTTSSSSSSSQSGNCTARTPPPAYSSPHPSPPLSPPSSHMAHPFPQQAYPVVPPQTPRPQNQFLPSQQQFLYPTPSPSPSPPQPMPSPAYSAPILRRRADKATPSTFTFASDSTKLGEIPMNKWNIPFNYAEMQRLNEEYYAGSSNVTFDQEYKPKRPGLFGRMFGKKKAVTDE
jgi:hypothetical protein